jgi:hypothetical protein
MCGLIEKVLRTSQLSRSAVSRDLTRLDLLVNTFPVSHSWRRALIKMFHLAARRLSTPLPHPHVRRPLDVVKLPCLRGCGSSMVALPRVPCRAEVAVCGQRSSGIFSNLDPAAADCRPAVYASSAGCTKGEGFQWHLSARREDAHERTDIQPGQGVDCATERSVDATFVDDATHMIGDGAHAAQCSALCPIPLERYIRCREAYRSSYEELGEHALSGCTMCKALLN